MWILLALILAAPLAHASYSIDVQPINNEIGLDESATYNVTIRSFEPTESRFQVYTIDAFWSVKTSPVTPSVPANGETSFILSLRPGTDARAGAQGVGVTFKDLATGTLIKQDVVLNLRTGITPVGEYVPAVALELIMPYDVDPRAPVPMRIDLRNRNGLNISSIAVQVSSPHFSTSFAMPLPPLSERTRDVPGLALDPLTAPAEEEVSVRLIYNGQVINQLEKNYRIEEYTSIRQRVDSQEFLFKTQRDITVTNDGNVANTAIVRVPTSLLTSLFVSSSLQYSRAVEDGQRELMWSVPLGPGESKTFTYTENYRILLLLAVLAVCSAVLYLVLRSPVIVLKEAVGVVKEDGVSRIKVRIFVKNRSARLIRDLEIADRVPSLADVIGEERSGSIAPSKVAVSDKKGTLLRWNLDVLEPYEERVLTYQAKSKLKIIGRMSLPNAKAKFMVRERERVVFSNNIELVEKFRER